MVLAHQRHGFGFEHARAVELATVQEHAHETSVVARGRGQAAAADRRRDGQPRLRRLQDDVAVHAFAGTLLRGDQARALLLRHVVGGVGHLERPEDVLAEIVLELLAGNRLDQLSDDVGAGAVVPALAGIEQQGPTERIGLAGRGLKSRQVVLVNG